MNTDEVRDRINERIEAPCQNEVDVKTLVSELVDAVNTEIDESDGDPEKRKTVDATWEVLERREPYLRMSHTERLYTVGFLFTNYGVTPSWLTEDRRVSHAETWDDITIALCEYALYEVVNAFVTGDLKENPHSVGDFQNSRKKAVQQDFQSDLETDPLRNIDVHNWIAVLASNVSTRLANHDDVDPTDRSDVQHTMTDAEAETVEEAIHDVIEEEAREELLTRNLITTGSFLDALEDLYLLDGSDAIESDQLSNAAASGWLDAVTSGILWHAMAEAIRVHRDTYAETFKENIGR